MEEKDKLEDSKTCTCTCGSHKGVVRKFVIPIGGELIDNPNKKWWQFWKKSTIRNKISREKAETQIKELISNYKEVYDWDELTAEVKINGTHSLPYKKEYWFPINKKEDI